MCCKLQISLLLIFLPYQAMMASSRGYFVNLNDNRNTLIDNTLSAAYIIKTIFLKEVNVYGDHAGHAPECVRHCLKEDNCSTVVTRAVGSTTYCYLSKYSTCDNLGAFVRSSTGYHTYDVRKAEEDLPSLSCTAKCMLQNSCSICGRNHCSGPKCDQCHSNCWSIPRSNKWIFFWPTLAGPTHVHCAQEWQYIYGTHWTLRFWTALQQEPLVLRLGVHCEATKKSFFSYFDGFTLISGKLTVGSYLGGNAGNFWNAPFTDRALTDVSKSNCKSFWYGLAECEVTVIDSYETQIANNVTTIARRAKWDICPGADDCNARHINFRITKRTDTLIQEKYESPIC